MATPAILVVEDDAVQREGLRAILEREGYAVTLTAGPAEALARLSAGPAPELILLAMLFPRVPDGDGWSFLRERQRRPNVAAVPVILTTAVGKGAEWAASPGARGYVRKPMDVEPLLAEGRRLLPGRQAVMVGAGVPTRCRRPRRQSHAPRRIVQSPRMARDSCSRCSVARRARATATSCSLSSPMTSRCQSRACRVSSWA